VSEPKAILVIRRDNIGDLVCTTPFLSALRKRFPDTWLAVYANSYNAPILARHPDIDEVIVYRKAKHYPDVSRLALLLERVRLVRRLRAERLDYVILAAPGEHRRQQWFARLLAPKCIVGFAKNSYSCLDVSVPIERTQDLHEVEAVFLLAGVFGIEGPPPPLSIPVDPAELTRIRSAIQVKRIAQQRPLAGVHISARKPSQRWPTDRFVALMRALHRRHGCAFILFWSPGDENDPRHPGDDHKARQALEGARGVPVLSWSTHGLPSLVAGLAACDRVICSDGGAMHIAAALGKPIVCLFGDSDPGRWRPWGRPHELLQPTSRDVADISVDDVLAAYERLSVRAAT